MNKDKNYIYLGLGSNIGDSILFLKQAIYKLSCHSSIEIISQSSPYRTKAWGNTEQNDFYNCVIKILFSHQGSDTDQNLFELLEICQQIELDLGRERNIIWGPRTIDIDLLWVDGFSMATSKLTLPHSYFFQRPFVLIPLSEINSKFNYLLQRFSENELAEVHLSSWN